MPAAVVALPSARLRLARGARRAQFRHGAAEPRPCAARERHGGRRARELLGGGGAGGGAPRGRRGAGVGARGARPSGGGVAALAASGRLVAPRLPPEPLARRAATGHGPPPVCDRGGARAAGGRGANGGRGAPLQVPGDGGRAGRAGGVCAHDGGALPFGGFRRAERRSGGADARGESRGQGAPLVGLRRVGAREARAAAARRRRAAAGAGRGGACDDGGHRRRQPRDV
mmetsp:Transcript_34658/g.95627  ORF Transcript_34658/g.95627 Transcript_34658/m.95627 type:complete len:229 (+) Transcript_34658:212-898(+)